MDKKELTPIQKMILVCGMAQLSIDYIDDLLEDPQYGFHFVRELKRNAKNHQKSLEDLITKILHGEKNETKEQFQDIYVVVSRLIENGLIWPEEEVKTQS